MAAEVGASAAAQQQIALPPEGADITNIQDEDLLRRMWQETEDFGRKKEIRARMYKLREQRLKEFYTTGEVLSDLMSTTIDGSTSAADGSANNAGVASTIVTTRRTTYAASEGGDSVGGGGLVVTTTETIRGGGGSQESLVIRYRSSGNEDENLKNIEMDRRQVQESPELIYESGGKTTRSSRTAMTSSSNQSSSMITKSANYGIHSQSLADQGFLTMKSKEIRDSESPTRDFSHLTNRQLQQTSSTTRGGPIGGGGGYWYEESRTYHSGDDGMDSMQYNTSGGGRQGYSSSSVIEYGDGGTTTIRAGENVGLTEQREQIITSATKREESSKHQEKSSSSSYSFSSDNRSTQDWVQRHQDDDSFVHPTQTQPMQIENVRGGGVGYVEEIRREERIVRENEKADETGSIRHEEVTKTERVIEKTGNETRVIKDETEFHKTTERVDEVETREEPRGPKQRVTQRSKTGELPLEVNIAKQVTTEVITSVPSTADSTPLPETGPTPDVGSWTVVSGKQNGVCSSTDEFVFRSGTTTTSSTQDATQKIISSETATREDAAFVEPSKITTTITSTTTPASGKPSSMPTAGKPTPVDSPVTSPSVEVKSIMKQTTTTTTTQQVPAPSGYYIQTKRISTEVSPTHDAFAKSLRSSPEKTTSYTTRASSKSSIDTNTTTLSSPTRIQRTSVTSPTGPSSSPDRGTSTPRDKISPMKQQTPSPCASKEKRKLSSSLSKGVGGKRTATPGASPSASPVRGRSPCTDDEASRKPLETSPDKKRPSIAQDGSPFSEQPTRKSPGKETKPSTRKTPEKSPCRETPKDIETHPDISKSTRKPSDATTNKETKSSPTTPTGRRPSKSVKDDKPAGRKVSSDRLSSPAGSPMKEKGPEFTKERKPSEDKRSPISPQRPKDLDLKTGPVGTEKTTPGSPLDRTPTKPKELDKVPDSEKRRLSKGTSDDLIQTIVQADKPTYLPILKTNEPEDDFDVVCEAPETLYVKVVASNEPAYEQPEEPETKKPTTTEISLKGSELEKKNVIQELEIERIKKPSAIPSREPAEEHKSPYKLKDKSPLYESPKRTPSFKTSSDKEFGTPKKPNEEEEKELPKVTRPKSPEIRPTRKESSLKKYPLKDQSEIQPIENHSPSMESPIRDTQCRDEGKRSPSPSREIPASRSPTRKSPEKVVLRKESISPKRDICSPSGRSPVRDSPDREYQRKHSPSPARDTLASRSPSRTPTREYPPRESKRPASPSPVRDSPKSFSPSRGSPTRGSPAREIPRKSSPARDVPYHSTSRRSPAKESPVRDSPKKHSPSPAREVPKTHSPSREFSVRGSPLRDSPRKHSPSPSKDTYSPTRKSPSRDSPARDLPRKHSPSPAKEYSKGYSPTRTSPSKDSPLRDSPRKHSPSPAKDSPRIKSPARDSPLRDSPRKHSPSPARDSVGRYLKKEANVVEDMRRGYSARKSPTRDIPTKTEKEPPCRRHPEDKPQSEKYPTRKLSIKDAPRKHSPSRKTPERDVVGRSPARQSPMKDTSKKIPECDMHKKVPARTSPTKEVPRKDSPARKPYDNEGIKKPTLTRKSSEKERLTPKKDTTARRSQSTEIPGTKRASPFNEAPKTDDIPTRRAPSTESPTRKSPSKDTSSRKIPHYASPVRHPADTPTKESPSSTTPIAESPHSDKPWRQTSFKSPSKDTTSSDTLSKMPVKEYPASGIPRTMSPARKPGDTLPSSPDSPKQKDGKPHSAVCAPDKTPLTQRPSRSPERATIRKHPDEMGQKPATKPFSKIPGRTSSSSITPPSPRRQTPASSIPSYTTPLRRGPKDESSPSTTVDSPKIEPKGTIGRTPPGSRIPESSIRRPGESPIGRKTVQTTTTNRKSKKPKKKMPISGTETSEDDEISTSETDEEEHAECIEERVTVMEKEVRRVNEVFVQDMSAPQFHVHNGSPQDRPVSLSLITTTTKTVTSGGEVQQTIDSDGHVTTTTYQQPSTITMSVSRKNRDFDGQEEIVTRTVKKTSYPDRPDEDEDVEIIEIDEDDVSKPLPAIEYPSDDEPLKRPGKTDSAKPNTVVGAPKRIAEPTQPTTKKDTKPQSAPSTGKRPTVESPSGRQPINGEPGKRRIPATTTSPSPKKPTAGKRVTQVSKTAPVCPSHDDKSSPKTQRKPGQISRLPAKQAPKPETKRIAVTTGKTVVQQQHKTSMVSAVSATTRQQTNYVTSTTHKTQPKQPMKVAPQQPKQQKLAPKGRIPHKTGKGIPIKETKKKVTNGRVPYSDEPEDEDDTEEEYDDRESPITSDIEKTEKYYSDEETLVEGKITDITMEKKVPQKPTDARPAGLHPSSAVSTPTGIPTSTEIRPVSRESTPDAPGRRQHPRYADRVSEPDDDELYYEGTTRITRTGKEITEKKTIDHLERTINVTMPRLETVDQHFEEEDELHEFERLDVERRRQLKSEQVTDLDEDEPKVGDDDEIEPATLSVASKVSRFLTASATAAAPPQPSQTPKMTETKRPRRPSWEPEDAQRQPKGDEVDQKTYMTEDIASFAVKRARDMFETIAKTPTATELTPTPTAPKIKTDVLGKATMFETRQVDEIHRRERKMQRHRQSFTGSEESLGEEGLPKEKPCTDFTDSEEEYEDEPIVQVKESPLRRPIQKETSPARTYKPQVERDRPKEISPIRTFKSQPEKEMPKESSPSRTFKPRIESDIPKEVSPGRTFRPTSEKPDSYTPRRKSVEVYDEDVYDEPSEDEAPQHAPSTKFSPREKSPESSDNTSPKQTDTDATRRRNIFRDGASEDDLSPKVKKTSVGSTMGREAFLKRMSKFASTEEDKSKPVQPLRETPKLKSVSKFPTSSMPSERTPKPTNGEPNRRPSKDNQSPPRKISTDTSTRRISRDEPESVKRSPARDTPSNTDTYTRRPSKDQPRSEIESPRRTPTRDVPGRQSESPKRTDTYNRRPSKEQPRTDRESPRRTPTRDTPSHPSEPLKRPGEEKRPNTDTYTRKPSREQYRGEPESPRRTPIRETQPRKPQDERRPSTDTSVRRSSRDYMVEEISSANVYEETAKGCTFTRRPSKDRVREDDSPKKPQDGTFTRKPKPLEEITSRIESSDLVTRGSDTFTRRTSKDRQSPRRDSPMRLTDDESPRNTGTFTRKTSTNRFKESSISPRSSPVRDIQPKSQRPSESPRRPSQDRPADDKPKGSDTFTRRRSQPKEDEPKKPTSAADALKPYLRTRTQEFPDEDDNKLKPEDKSPKKLSSSRFETFTKRDSSTTVTKDDSKRTFPTGVDRTPKKLSGSRFDTFSKKDSSTSVKATTETVVSRTKKSSTRRSVEREEVIESRDYEVDRPRYEEPTKPRKTSLQRESPSRTDRVQDRRTPDRKTPDRADRRTPEKPDMRTPERTDRRTPERREESPVTYGEPLRKKPTKESDEEPVRKAPRPEDEEVEPRSSTRRRASKEGSPHPEVRPEDDIPEQQRRRSSGGKFGVVLRQLSSVGSRVEALLSKVEKRAGTTTTTTSTTVALTPTKRRPSKGPEPGVEIEEIFDLEYLELMLEKATDYDQRRRIRAQIRIVRRGEGKSEPVKEPTRDTPKERDSPAPSRPTTLSTKTTPRQSSAPEEPDVEDGRRGKPRQPSQSRESPEKVTSISTPKRKPSRAEEIGGELTSPSVVAKLLPSPSTGTPSSPASRPSPAPATSVPKKNSLTSSSGLPREACPTDSITSSYGVGPTDESGRPLFGLRALRRPQQQPPPDSVPSAPAPSPNTQSREASLEPRPQSPETSDIRDSSGRPLFGLRAITISSTSKTTKEGRKVTDRAKSPETGERPGSQSSSEDEEDVEYRKEMPSTSTASTVETSVHLRDLVRRHEQNARGNVPSQPVAPFQKPRAKLRDSFILNQQSLDDEEEDVVEGGRSPARPVGSEPQTKGTSPASKTFPSVLPSSLTESGKVISERSCTLKSIIQKHEKIADTEQTNDKLNRRDSGLGAYTGEHPETTTVKVTSDVVRRPGILKKPKDSEVVETCTATSTASTIRSQQTVSEKSSSGYVSLKKDVIRSVDSEEAGEEEEEMLAVTDVAKGRTSKKKTVTGRRSSNDLGDEAPSSRATYSSYTTTSSSSSSSLARSGGEVERRRSSNTTPYTVDEGDGDANDGIEVIRSPSDSRYSATTTTTVTRRTVSGSESPKVVTTTTTVKKATGRPDEEETEVLVQEGRGGNARKKFEPPSPALPSPGTGFSRVARGGSVRALSQKFQQAAGTKTTSGEVVERRTVTSTSTRAISASQKDDASNEYLQQIRRRSVENDRGSSPTSSRQSTDLSTVSSSRACQPIVDEYDVDDIEGGEMVTVEQRTVVVTNGSTGSQGRSFLGNQAKVTGVQDVLSRMREADNEGPADGDTVEDGEARALLNKFLGAQVILQGMEPLINAQSPSLVRQVEKQRVQKKQESNSTSIVYTADLDLDGIWDERRLRQLLDSCTDYDGRRKIRARIRTVMAEQKVTAAIVAEGRLEAERESQESSGRSKAIVSKQSDDGETETSTTVLRSVQGHSEATSVSSSTESSVTKTEVHTKTSNYSATVTGKSRVSKAPPSKVMSPFAKFKQLDEQNAGSAPNSPKSPGGTGPLFKFTDPQLCRSASGVKDRLLYWCQIKTKEYKNIQIENFSTSWSNGLAFCALIHHFCPEAFDYDTLRPEERRKNFELAFRVADDKAGIAPLLDVEDMVMMRKPDWKCVFTYVQSIYRRFKDED